LPRTKSLVLDTSAIVALLCGWHVRHADVLAEIEKRVAVLTLTAREHWLLVEEAQLGGVAGGRMYDALIARCAKKAAAPTLLTLNVRHFASFEDEELALATV
jgi:predicted nucleic acid-binding protein